MTRIDHTNHAHPATPEARRRCRAAAAIISRNAAIVAEQEAIKAEANGWKPADYVAAHMNNVTQRAKIKAMMDRGN